MTTTRDSHAVVLGGSLAGLCAAAALAPHVDRVTLVERDAFPDEPRWRRGVPQARHTHNLMLGGQRALEQLFPGLMSALRELGMVEVRMPQDMRLLVPGGWVDRFSSHHVVLSGSRDLLDWAVRRELRKRPGVTVRQETEVLGLAARDGVVTGVRLRSRATADATAATAATTGAATATDAARADTTVTTDTVGAGGGAAGAGWGEPYTLEADFVVDATGRTSRAPNWLRELGYEAPKEEVVDAGCAYASCVLAPPPTPRDWRCMLLQSTPEEPRSGIINPIEQGRWIVSVAGMGGERPPLDHAGFVDFAKRLRSTELYEAIRDAEPLGEVHGSGRTENRRRRYERLRRWPDRFLVMGDAAGAFNPAYGQGISVAALSALELRDAVGRAPTLAGLAGPMRRRVARRVDQAWMLSGNADLAYPGAAEGDRLPLAARLGKRYTDRMLRVATTDHTVASALFDMTHLIAPPQVVLRPRVFASVLRGRQRP
ncbi:NAD(P)/FAD-dependent oxidoreductase [Streptomyces sp. 4N509B]|uniref:NAD(P)/FAD-dependent oxidoreductase n=1 Tax=Streptomyces sp. 4N509B TaxID=3457413 RepID=UPI003FD49711